LQHIILLRFLWITLFHKFIFILLFSKKNGDFCLFTNIYRYKHYKSITGETGLSVFSRCITWTFLYLHARGNLTWPELLSPRVCSVTVKMLIRAVVGGCSFPAVECFYPSRIITDVKYFLQWINRLKKHNILPIITLARTSVKEIPICDINLVPVYTFIPSWFIFTCVLMPLTCRAVQQRIKVDDFSSLCSVCSYSRAFKYNIFSRCILMNRLPLAIFILNYPTV